PRPISDPAFEIASHVKGEAEIARSETLSGDFIGGAKEAGGRVLPIADKTADYRFELRIPVVIFRPTPQNQSNEMCGGEVELFAMVDALLRQARDEEAFQVTFESVGVVDAIEEARRRAIEIGREEMVD